MLPASSAASAAAPIACYGALDLEPSWEPPGDEGMPGKEKPSRAFPHWAFGPSQIVTE
jgi:hypothetical protein